MGSEEWKDLYSNKYGGSDGLAISGKESADGLLIASYESGQVAYQLNRYLKHKANGAKFESQIEDIILKDLHSVQPCKLVPGGPGGYRCAVSDDDEGDNSDQQAAGGGPPAAPTAAGGGSGGKGGVLGLGFLGLKGSPQTGPGTQTLAQSAEQKAPPLTLEQAKKLESQIGVLREDAWVSGARLSLTRTPLSLSRSLQ